MAEDTRRMTWATAFALLFCAYHLPELLELAGVPAGIASSALLLFFPLAVWIARRQGRGPLQAYGLSMRHEWWAWLAVLFLLALVAKGVAVWAGAHFGMYITYGPLEKPPRLVDWLGLLLLTVVPSVAEDMLTRGVFLHSPLARSGRAFVWGTAIVYVLNHVSRLALGWTEWVMLLCFGIAYGLAAWRAGTLWAAVGLHWGWNFAGRAVDAVWQVDVVAPQWVKLLSGVAHLAMAVVVLAVTTRKQEDGSPGSPPARG